MTEDEFVPLRGVLPSHLVLLLKAIRNARHRW
jgi:hypothetical protein